MERCKCPSSCWADFGEGSWLSFCFIFWLPRLQLPPVRDAVLPFHQALNLVGRKRICNGCRWWEKHIKNSWRFCNNIGIWCKTLRRENWNLSNKSMPCWSRNSYIYYKKFKVNCKRCRMNRPAREKFMTSLLATAFQRHSHVEVIEC